MSKEIIEIRADNKEKAEMLARGVWAVCPDAEIRIFYPISWAYGSGAGGAYGAGACGACGYSGAPVEEAGKEV